MPCGRKENDVEKPSPKEITTFNREVLEEATRAQVAKETADSGAADP